MAKKKDTLSQEESQELEALLEDAYQVYASSIEKPLAELTDEEKAEALKAAGLVELTGDPEEIAQLQAYLVSLESNEQQEEEPVAGQLPPNTDAQDWYELDEWKGLKQYKCKLCPWDTLDGETAILEHIAKTHIAAPVLAPMIPVANASGKQIN